MMLSKTRQSKNTTSPAQYLHFSGKHFEKELLKSSFSVWNQFALLSHCCMKTLSLRDLKCQKDGAILEEVHV